MYGKVYVRIDGLSVEHNAIEMEKTCFISGFDDEHRVVIQVISTTFPNVMVELKIPKKDFKRLLKRMDLETYGEDA